MTYERMKASEALAIVEDHVETSESLQALPFHEFLGFALNGAGEYPLGVRAFSLVVSAMLPGDAVTSAAMLKAIALDSEEMADLGQPERFAHQLDHEGRRILARVEQVYVAAVEAVAQRFRASGYAVDLSAITSLLAAESAGSIPH